MVLILITTHNCDCQVPKLSDGQHNAENQRSLPDVVGTKKQVSYKTEIIGGVPIVTQTQVKWSCDFTHIKCKKTDALYLSQIRKNNTINEVYS